MKHYRDRAAWLAVACFVAFLTGCAPAAVVPGSQTWFFFDTARRYPGTQEPLKLQKLSDIRPLDISKMHPEQDAYIVVHPAYSLFIGDSKKRRHDESKYALMNVQFENEARFISETSRAGSILILILPGGYAEESELAESYTAYLNATTLGGARVFYLFSDSLNDGTISTDDMVDLYRFLQQAKVGKVLIGGGYIGRCQREFYNELTTYYDRSRAYIVPEISTISPEDITKTEAAGIVSSLQRKDFTPIKKFIDKRFDYAASIFSLPPRKKP